MIIPNAPGIAFAAILIGAGVAVCTPIAFATPGRGRTGRSRRADDGAGEVGRELGEGGGPLLVGAFSPAGLAVGLLALAGAIGLGALTSRHLARLQSYARGPARDPTGASPSTKQRRFHTQRPTGDNMASSDHSSNSIGTPASIDMNLEVVTLPVSDVERAKRFYEGLGSRLDADMPSATTSG